MWLVDLRNGFVGVGGGSGPSACIPRVPTSLSPTSSLSCANQFSLKVPSSRTTSNTASGQRSTASHSSTVDLRRAASLSSSGDNYGSSGPTSTFAPATLIQAPITHVFHSYHLPKDAH